MKSINAGMIAGVLAHGEVRPLASHRQGRRCGGTERAACSLRLVWSYWLYLIRERQLKCVSGRRGKYFLDSSQSPILPQKHFNRSPPACIVSVPRPLHCRTAEAPQCPLSRAGEGASRPPARSKRNLGPFAPHQLSRRMPVRALLVASFLRTFLHPLRSLANSSQ